jgi:hypothetical protein
MGKRMTYTACMGMGMDIDMEMDMGMGIGIGMRTNGYGRAWRNHGDGQSGIK